MRIVSFFTLLFVLPLIPFWLAVIAFAAYAFFWPEYELVLVGFCVDLFFGVSSTIPVYASMATVLIICSLWLRPYLSVYNGS